MILSGFLFFFSLSNIAFPGSINFSGEFLVLFSIVAINNSYTVFLFFGLLLNVVYTLLLFTKISGGNPKTEFIINFYDLTKTENFILSVFAFYIILLGFFPNLLLSIFYPSAAVLFHSFLV